MTSFEQPTVARSHTKQPIVAGIKPDLTWQPIHNSFEQQLYLVLHNVHSLIMSPISFLNNNFEQPTITNYESKSHF